MGLLDNLKKYRLKILKIIITLVVIYFLICVILQMLSILFDDIYSIITLTYILILILCNFVVEFSPYILNTYLIYIFPFLSYYSGRGALYILIGIASITPKLNHLLNIGGYSLICLGLLCFYINWILEKDIKSKYHNLENLKNNYHEYNNDIKEDSNKDNNFGNNYNIDLNSINNQNNTINNNLSQDNIKTNYKSIDMKEN